MANVAAVLFLLLNAGAALALPQGTAGGLTPGPDVMAQCGVSTRALGVQRC
jgi:hypothetical protein